MARWFLVAPELSRHHDLSDVLTKRCNENAQKLKDVLKVSDPFATECHLVNIITKAVMPDYIKEGVLMQDDIGQAYFGTLGLFKKKSSRPHEKGRPQVMEVCLANKEKQNN